MEREREIEKGEQGHRPSWGGFWYVFNSLFINGSPIDTISLIKLISLIL